MPALLALGVLVLLHLLQFPFALLVIDSGRDLANAWAIAHGQAWPARGPEIYGVWSLGPVWYYVLAVPFVFGGSVGAAAAWVGLLASLKIPFAFLLGRRVHSVAAGLLFAALIAMPGWSSAATLVIVHTAVIETAVLGALLACVHAAERRRLGALGIAAAASSLALHAHPTAVIVVPWLGLAVMRTCAAGARGRAAGMLAATVCVFMLPWLPMLIAESAQGWPQLRDTQRFAAQLPIAERLQQVPAILWGMFTGWPRLVGDYLLHPPGMATPVMRAASLLMLLGAGMGGAVALWHRPRATFAMLAFVLAAVSFISVLRPDPQAYMYFAVVPLLVGLLAWGWLHLLPPRAVHGAAWSLLAVALMLQASMLARRAVISVEGTLPFPGDAVADVRTPVRDDGWQRFWLAAAAQTRAASALCGESRAVHGELAAAFAWAHFVALVDACDERRRPRIGGADADTHLAGMPRAHARELGVDGSRLGGGFILVPVVDALYPQTGALPIVEREYAPVRYRRLAAQAGPQRLQVAVPRCASGQLLVVANLMPGLNPLVAEVSTPSGALTPLLATLAASYYRCDEGALAVDIGTLDPAAVDVFVIVAGEADQPSAAHSGAHTKRIE